MSTEAALLGVISAFRATPLAVIYGLLLAPRPARLLLAYTLAGLFVSLAVGIAVVAGFHESAPSRDAGTTRMVIDLVLGVVALGYAAGRAAGRFAGDPTSSRDPLGGALGARLRRPSTLVAGAAGGLTNLPGLFYIAGLVAILQTEPSGPNGVVQVLIYNVLRFAVPLAALVAASVNPARTRELTDALHAWGTRHSGRLVVGVCAVAGLFLAVKGLTGLLG
ncbi:GAP family protein [Actinomycetospora endophytica]|uniref:GAP family protein n=1 Tax=Actinomycetospora endophytica TaxID=2291215 RepID=A0ABS8PD98_9PSEU|nr:GAP family protein [Actinomycetospora endophytica]MCD2195440.1 GAP family protein [Actinomycetospora endophytica]